MSSIPNSEPASTIDKSRRSCLWMPLSLWMFVAILDFIGIGGCGKWPPVAESKSQIARLDVTTASVRVRGLPDADIPALARLRELKDLDFAGGMAVEDAAITDDGIEALAKLALPKLDSLDLGYNTKITNAGLVHVAKIETLSMLLLPACPNITGAGLEHLIGMKRLVYLDLRGCQGITDDALQTLASKPDLEQLQLGGCRKVTERGVAQLQVSLPNLRIVKDDKQWNDYDRQYEK